MSITSPPKGIGPAQFILDESGKDIPQTAKKTLGDYLSSRTRGGAESYTEPVQGGGDYTYMPPRQNSYPIPPDLTKIVADASYTSPQVFTLNDIGASKSESPAEGSTELRKLVETNPSSGRSNNGGTSGHTLLKNEAASISKVVQNSVLKSNRFSTGDKKFTSKTYTEAMTVSPIAKESVYETMRKAAMVSMLNAAGGTDGSSDYTLGNILKGGRDVLGDVVGDGSPVEGDVVNPTNLVQHAIKKVETATLRPGAKREKIPAPTRPLEFASTTEDSTDTPMSDDIFQENDSKGDIVGAQPPRYTNTSFGQLNTYLEQFSGVGTGNMILLALVAYIALFIATALVAVILSIILFKLPRENSRDSSAQLGSERGPAFGKFFFDPTAADGFSLADTLPNLSNLIAKILGLMQPYGNMPGLPVFHYFTHALEGALALVGIDGNTLLGLDGTPIPDVVANVVLNFALTPGYYLTLIREIARDMALFADFNNGGGGSGIFGILEKIRTLKIVRFVDTCARLGIVSSQRLQSDRSIDPGERVANGPIPAGGDDKSDVNTTANAYEVARKRVSRSRETEGSKRLAWSHSSLGYTRSELITPDLIRALERERITTLGGTDSGLSSLRRLKARKIASTTGRISAEDRKYHENLLDAEYMPFYFHDLRTNEILSFHAFLSSLTDGYTANYTSTDGFGRMDPVQTYKNTTRAVSFTFNVVATSPDDHAQMWYSINKLVNMVYPQWSEGDTITGEGGETFTQPFSQTIAASPMLRVRIGDVIHSNYSRFGLGRIFGLEKANAALPGTAVDTATGLPNPLTPSGSLPTTFTGTEDSKTPGKSFQVNTSTSDNDLNSMNSLKYSNDPISATVATLQNALLGKTVIALKIKRYPVGTYTDFIFEKDFTHEYNNDGRNDDTGTIVKFITAANIKDPLMCYVKMSKGFTPAGGFLLYEYVKAAVTDIEIANSEIVTADEELAQSLTSNFMDPAKNAVVRSFEEGAGGRGLAGFITSLGLEYGSTDTTWTTDTGARAPNMVSIVVSFTPIHDIPMGLAADGTARAAAYPVGDVTRRRFYQDLVQNDKNIAASLPPRTIDMGIKK